MGFQQGLSGLNAASTQLDTIGNNIANANTYGFKSSRSEFADIYGNTLYGIARTSPGIGVRVAAITQNMSNGNVSTTGRSLDIAINNSGYFTVARPDGTLAYTRNGQFQVSNQGYIVNDGNQLQGWQADSAGVVTQGQLTNLRLDTNLISPEASTKGTIGINLDSRVSPPTVTPLDPTNASSYNWANTNTVYDSLGNPHQVTLYYVAGTPTATGNSWTATAYVDGSPATTPNTYSLDFNTSGVLTNTTPFNITFTPNPVNGSAIPQTVALSFTGSTQVGQNFGVTTPPTIDGFAPGTLKGINISSTGIVQATFTNGQTKTIGQIALANFINQQGLQPIGDNLWSQTFDSGAASYNAPGSGNVGTVQAGALEDSNVDLTGELVNMITTQRYYQANAQTIKTQDTLVQTLLNI
ncbi:flagellar hook protein FlgE [Neisseriaceae bacterium TC5R-5]|nr:flagellar hook protein FlgE [Neisseriaceae bacterium TC5R-5]